MKELLNKVFAAIDHYHTYHCWYSCYNAECHDTYISFEVHCNSDQGEGADWIEYWSIDDEGKIYAEDIVYNSFEEFLREWS